MDKIKRVFQNMSLKKSLVLLAVVCLGVVSVLSIVTILIFSDIRQGILDTRPIIVTGFTSEADADAENGLTVVPQEYTHGELLKENRIYYWAATVSLSLIHI